MRAPAEGAGFCAYGPVRGAGVDAAPTVPLCARFNVVARATRGLRTLHEKLQGPGASPAAPPFGGEGSRTLPDGSLRLGTDLPLLARRYRYVSTISGGTSAQVIQAEDTYSALRDRVAIKIVRAQYAEQAAQEARLLRYLAAPRRGAEEPCEHVVRLLDAFAFEGHACLVMERLYGSLADYALREVPSLPAAEALRATRKIGAQLLATLLYLRRRGVVHADIKPDNILFAEPRGAAGGGGGGSSMRLKLADFGNAFTLAQAPQLFGEGDLQTLDYRAPEVVLGSPFGCEIDAWSAGVALAELALGRPCFSATSAPQLLSQIAGALGRPPPPDVFGSGELYARTMRAAGLSPGAAAPPPAGAAASSPARGERGGLHSFVCKKDRHLADLLSQLLGYDPAERLPPARALCHPFFAPLFPFAELARDVARTTAAGAQAQQQSASIAGAAAGGGDGAGAAGREGGEGGARAPADSPPGGAAAKPEVIRAPVAVAAAPAGGSGQGSPPWLAPGNPPKAAPKLAAGEVAAAEVAAGKLGAGKLAARKLAGGGREAAGEAAKEEGGGAAIASSRPPGRRRRRVIDDDDDDDDDGGGGGGGGGDDDQGAPPGGRGPADAREAKRGAGGGGGGARGRAAEAPPPGPVPDDESIAKAAGGEAPQRPTRGRGGLGGGGKTKGEGDNDEKRRAEAKEGETTARADGAAPKRRRRGASATPWWVVQK